MYYVDTTQVTAENTNYVVFFENHSLDASFLVGALTSISRYVSRDPKWPLSSVLPTTPCLH